MALGFFSLADFLSEWLKGLFSLGGVSSIRLSVFWKSGVLFMNDTTNDGDFNPDYHETEEFENGVFALGMFIIAWNFAENNFGQLLASFAGETGQILALGLGNQSKSNAMMELARASDAGPDFLDAIEFACKAFGRLKDNRNALAHAHSITKWSQEDKPKWVRQPKNPKSYTVYVYADEQDVFRNIIGAKRLATYLISLLLYSGHFHKTLGDLELPRRPLPEKFELPDALTPHSLARSLLRPPPQS